MWKKTHHQSIQRRVTWPTISFQVYQLPGAFLREVSNGPVMALPSGNAVAMWWRGHKHVGFTMVGKRWAVKATIGVYKAYESFLFWSCTLMLVNCGTCTSNLSSVTLFVKVTTCLNVEYSTWDWHEAEAEHDAKQKFMHGFITGREFADHHFELM